MDTENSPLHKLFEQLVAEGVLDPELAKKLLDEIQAIISDYQGEYKHNRNISICGCYIKKGETKHERDKR